MDVIARETNTEYVECTGMCRWDVELRIIHNKTTFYCYKGDISLNVTLDDNGYFVANYQCEGPYTKCTGMCS